MEIGDFVYFRKVINEFIDDCRYFRIVSKTADGSGLFILEYSHDLRILSGLVTYCSASTVRPYNYDDESLPYTVGDK